MSRFCMEIGYCLSMTMAISLNVWPCPIFQDAIRGNSYIIGWRLN